MILDIGAHIGLFSLYLSRRWPNARIFAVEPHPDNLHLLRANLDLNNAANVTILPVAVSGTDGTVTLSGDMRFNNGAFSLFASDAALNSHSLEVPGVALRSLCTANGLTDIDLLKVDCEGAEYLIFNDDFPYTCVRNLRVEAHRSSALTIRGYRPETLAAQLGERYPVDRLHVLVRDKPD